MKILAKIMMGAGFCIMLTGMAGMDSESVIVPIVMAFVGIGIVAFGGYLESYYEWCEERREHGRNNRGK